MPGMDGLGRHSRRPVTNRHAISLGVAGTEDWQQLSAEPLMNEADVALYRAKQLGRNRCDLAKPSGIEEIRPINRTEASVPAG